MPIDRETFERYWNKTEIIREYKPMLFTFVDMVLPYTFIGEHHLGDRVVVMKGIIQVQKPDIMVAGHDGPQFLKGFDRTDELPYDAVYLFRNMGLPYCNITNSVKRKQEIEYRSLQDILREYDEKLKAKDDKITGLIKGIVEGVDVSLMQYSIKLASKSTSSNVRQFINRLKIQRGEQIHPDDSLGDIRGLFD